MTGVIIDNCLVIQVGDRYQIYSYDSLVYLEGIPNRWWNRYYGKKSRYLGMDNKNKKGEVLVKKMDIMLDEQIYIIKPDESWDIMRMYKI